MIIAIIVGWKEIAEWIWETLGDREKVLRGVRILAFATVLTGLIFAPQPEKTLLIACVIGFVSLTPAVLIERHYFPK